MLQHLGSCRFLYNRLLALSIESYKNEKTNFSQKWANSILKQLKQNEETSFLKETYAQVLQQTIINLDKAFQNFFRNLKSNKKAGFPKFKKKAKHRDSCRFTNQSIKILSPNKIKLTGKLNNIKFSCSKRDRKRLTDGKIVSATLRQVPSGKFFVSVCVDSIPEVHLKTKGEPIGIDMGLKEFAVLSDRTVIPNPRFKKSLERRLKLLQKSLSKKEIKSRNREKARLRLALLSEKVTNKRDDFLHKLSSQIAKSHEIVCVEDLNVKGMMQNHRLAGSIGDVSWNKFFQLLDYKVDKLVKVGRFYGSSKTCNRCGYVKSDLTLKDREWKCPECGNLNERDFNASLNIRDEGLRVLKEKEIDNNK